MAGPLTTRNLSAAARNSVAAYLVTAASVVLLMMVFGLLMRLTQAELIPLQADIFYQLMTLHGVGMVGVAALAGAAIMWYFLSQYVKLSTGIFLANLALFLAGVAMLLGSVFFGKFAGAWTVLHPLPALSMGVWGKNAAALFLGGVLVIGTGFLLMYLDVARAIIAEYGNLGRALGWPQLFGRQGEYGPPPAVVASTMVLIVNTLGLIAGASIAVMMIINLYWPDFAIDALLAKNMIYFFGHVFINATIYMAVIAVYAILPHYTQRPWKSNRVFLAAWNASTLMVMIIYPHHLLMDFSMPTWMLIMGQVISYFNGLPVLVVTAYGALMIVYRSGIRWDMASGFLLLSMFGWTAGVIPAIVDGTIVVNHVMHNTLWVPGHFHTYLLLGMIPMVFGFMYFLAKPAGETRTSLLDQAGFWLYACATLGFTFAFLLSGSASVPRRYAVHFPEWLPYDRAASLFAALLISAVLVFVARFFSRLRIVREIAP